MKTLEFCGLDEAQRFAINKVDLQIKDILEIKTTSEPEYATKHIIITKTGKKVLVIKNAKVALYQDCIEADKV